MLALAAVFFYWTELDFSQQRIILYTLNGHNVFFYSRSHDKVQLLPF